MRLAPASALALTLGACSGSVPVAGSPFDPVDFFAGHTKGAARLQTIIGSAHTVAVDSRGTRDSRGGLVLVQKIAEQGDAPRLRKWILAPEGKDHWTGTLTDAEGPVRVDRTATDVVIRYRMHGGAEVEQHLQRPPNGIVENHITVTRLGIRLAALDEQIHKVRN